MDKSAEYTAKFKNKEKWIRVPIAKTEHKKVLITDFAFWGKNCVLKGCKTESLFVIVFGCLFLIKSIKNLRMENNKRNFKKNMVNLH
jgi:hypothetical protein